VIVFALSALGLDWLMGRTGQVSIGNGALMAVGAYTTAISAQHSWAPFPVPLLLSGAFGAIAGLIVALPSLRLRGIYFALTTLALQFLVSFAAQEYERNSNQLSGLMAPPLRIFGHTFVYGPSYLALLAGILLVTLLLLSNMYRRLPGRMWLATKESELAASTIRVNVRRWKLVSFVGSSMLIAISGSLYAYYLGSVSSDTFSLTFAITFVVMTIVGGVNSMAGAIVGAALVTLAPQLLTTISDQVPNSTWLHNNLPAINNGLYGLLVLIVLLYLPRGIVPSIQEAFRRSRHRHTRSLSVAVYSPTEASSARAVEHSQAESSAAPLLEIKNLTVMYSNGAHALNGVHLDIGTDEAVSIVGRNGAGKSSLLRSVSGFFATEHVDRRGSVRFAGQELIRANPIRAAKLGIVLVPERDKVFPSLSVGEHLRHLGDPDVAKTQLPEVWEFLQRRWKSPAGLLSGGERQMLAIAVAASLQPRLILIDEMSLGLAPVMISRVSDVLQGLRSRTHISLLLVEQNVAVAESLGDRTFHMVSGELQATGYVPKLEQLS
jgi:ABC-type branched-subunit amino acid transport system permease subunit/ABC-type branched-subunit amino acid transport system ATPase component